MGIKEFCELCGNDLDVMIMRLDISGEVMYLKSGSKALEFDFYHLFDPG